MIIEDLNKIKQFLNTPTDDGFDDVVKFFDKDIVEEFFWLNAGLQNQELIFFCVLNKKPKLLCCRLIG